MAIITAMCIKSIKANKGLKIEEGLPRQTRMISLNDDNNMVLYMLVQNPNIKTLIGAAGVIAASGAAFISKNFIDGLKEVWVKQQEADIKRGKEEKLIDIETRSFANRHKILYGMIDQTSKELNNMDRQKFSVGFGGNKKTKHKKNIAFSREEDPKTQSKENERLKNNIIFGLIGVGTIIAGGLLTRKIFKDLGKVAKTVEAASEKLKENKGSGLGQTIKNMKNQIKEISQK